MILAIIRRGYSFGGIPGVIFSNGITWVELRRSSLHILKDFGMGKNSLENIIEEEVENLIQYIEDHWVNKPIDMSNFFSISVLSSLWRIISGESLPIDDEKLKYLCQLTQKGLVEKGDPLMALANQYPTFFKILIKGPIIYLIKGRSQSRHKQRFCINVAGALREHFLEGSAPLRY